MKRPRTTINRINIITVKLVSSNFSYKKLDAIDLKRILK